MKRKLPVLIAIILTLAIALSACQPIAQPIAPGNQADPLPSHVEQPPETTLPAEPANTDTQPAPVEETNLITMDKAIEIALKDAGFTEKDVTGLHAELERDDGVRIYDVDFYQNGKEYDYEIHAESGKILKPVKKTETTEKPASSGSSSSTTKPASSGSSTSSSTSKNITKDQAISKALSHAGLKKSQVSRLRAELDKDDGKTVYEVDFETAEWEYEYEINAKTGKIIKAEKDRND